MITLILIVPCLDPPRQRLIDVILRTSACGRGRLHLFLVRLQYALQGIDGPDVKDSDGVLFLFFTSPTGVGLPGSPLPFRKDPPTGPGAPAPCASPGPDGRPTQIGSSRVSPRVPDPGGSSPEHSKGKTQSGAFERSSAPPRRPRTHKHIHTPHQRDQARRHRVPHLAPIHGPPGTPRRPRALLRGRKRRSRRSYLSEGGEPPPKGNENKPPG